VLDDAPVGNTPQVEADQRGVADAGVGAVSDDQVTFGEDPVLLVEDALRHLGGISEQSIDAVGAQAAVLTQGRSEVAGDLVLVFRGEQRIGRGSDNIFGCHGRTSLCLSSLN
jgi:hypothetical protein